MKFRVARFAVALGAAAIIVIGAAFSGAARAADDHWVASWATSPAAYFVYVPPIPPAIIPGVARTFAPANIQPDLAFPFPDANKNRALNQTFRSIVKPDLWGKTMRLRFSNAFGTQPVTFNAVTVGLQEYSGNVVHGTITPLTFGGKNAVTIPAGQEIWSDGVTFAWVKDAGDPLVQGRNLAVSYSVTGDSGADDLSSGGRQDVLHHGGGQRRSQQ